MYLLTGSIAPIGGMWESISSPIDGSVYFVMALRDRVAGGRLLCSRVSSSRDVIVENCCVEVLLRMEIVRKVDRVIMHHPQNTRLS